MGVKGIEGGVRLLVKIDFEDFQSKINKPTLATEYNINKAEGIGKKLREQ